MRMLLDPAILLLGSPKKHWCRQRYTSRRVKAALSGTASSPHRAAAAGHVPQLLSSDLHRTQWDRGQGYSSRAQGRTAKQGSPCPQRAGITRGKRDEARRPERAVSPPARRHCRPVTVLVAALRAAGCGTAPLSPSTRCQ